MAGLLEVEEYLPGRPPTWVEIACFIAVPVVLGSGLQALSPLSPPAVALGFVGFAVLHGLLTQTRVGQRISERGGEIGILGRIAIGVLIGLVVTAVFRFEVVPTEFVQHVAFGALLFASLGIAVRVLYYPVRGWLPEPS